MFMCSELKTCGELNTFGKVFLWNVFELSCQRWRFLSVLTSVFRLLSRYSWSISAIVGPTNGINRIWRTFEKEERLIYIFCMLCPGSEMCEVPALCRTLLGRWAEVLAHMFSLLVLLGANIVYWILITNFLYFTVNYFVGELKITILLWVRQRNIVWFRDSIRLRASFMLIAEKYPAL